jgi:hypothetical protein
MPLLALWASNPTAIGQFTVEQIVAAAGSGDLRDSSDCAQELRSPRVHETGRDAYHTQWDEFLKEGERGYLVLGCMDRDHAFAIPTDVFCPLMEDLNTTRNEDGTYYWHIQLTEDASGDLSLIVPKRKNNSPLSEYRLKLHA